MARAGHEIASHSARHSDLAAPGGPVRGELGDSLARLSAEMRTRRGFVLAWPYWRSTAQARRAARRGYLAARSGTAFAGVYAERGVPSAAPRDLFYVNALAALLSASETDWMAAVDYARFRGGWFVAGFHGIDDGCIDRGALGWEAMPLERFRAALDWLARQDLWAAPFGRVVRYIEEREKAVLVRDRADDEQIAYRLLDGLDNQVFDQALTLRVPLPRGWSQARVLQSGVEMVSSVAGAHLVFDALPDGEAIVVQRLR
jgi:peptidoglycan/xylan/chitin deacetylase (PgdA/CDA1 family)